MARSMWTQGEVNLLKEHYKTKTIHELQKILMKSADSINSKIKRLKESGDIEGSKDELTVRRALKQRGK